MDDNNDDDDGSPGVDVGFVLNLGSFRDFSLFDRISEVHNDHDRKNKGGTGPRHINPRRLFLHTELNLR